MCSEDGEKMNVSLIKETNRFQLIIFYIGEISSSQAARLTPSSASSILQYILINLLIGDI